MRKKEDLLMRNSVKFYFLNNFYSINLIILLDTFINYLMPDYEKNCFIEYVQGGEEKFVFGNTNDPKLN